MNVEMSFKEMDGHDRLVAWLSHVGQTHTFTSCNGVLTLLIFRIYFM